MADSKYDELHDRFFSIVWLCDCEKFKERAARQAEGFCAYTAVAISRCIEDGSIEGPVR